MDSLNDRIALSRDNSSLAEKITGLEAQITDRDLQLITLTNALTKTRDELSQALERETSRQEEHLS